MNLPRHRVLREILRNYLTYEAFFSQSGRHIISHGEVQISFLDLQDCLRNLSDRKKQAVFLNVILDMKQKDVASIMGITTVSVGQYVESAMIQIAEMYYAEDVKYVSEILGKDDD